MSDHLDQLWIATSKLRRLEAGETLFLASDPVRVMYRVESGVVCLTRSLPQGTEIVFQRAGPGEILAEASLFSRSYHCHAVAVSAACVGTIPINVMRAAFAQNPKLGDAFARRLAAEVQRARTRAEVVSLKTVRERLDVWLDLNNGTMPPRGRWRDLALEIATSPEALYRELAARRTARRE